jgi:RND family efflux transporter MFP subunit
VTLARHNSGEISGLPAQVVVPPGQLQVVAAPVAGLVEQVTVAAGAEVRKGDVLAQLASPQLAEIQRGLLQAATQRQLAADSLKRDEQLLKEGIIAESRLRATQSQYAEAAAAYAERRQALRLAGVPEAAIARLQAGRTLGAAVEIRAPMDGVVLDVAATAGQRVEAAAPLLRIARLRPLWLEILMPVARIGRLAPGAAVRVPSAAAGGRVLAIGSSVAANQTVTVRAEIGEGAQRLRPGQFVEAGVASAAAAGEWRVPNAALARIGGKLTVFVQTPEGFAPQPMELVSEGAADSLVKGAVADDARIAVKGVAALKAAASGIGGE